MCFGQSAVGILSIALPFRRSTRGQKKRRAFHRNRVKFWSVLGTWSVMCMHRTTRKMQRVSYCATLWFRHELLGAHFTRRGAHFTRRGAWIALCPNNFDQTESRLQWLISTHASLRLAILEAQIHSKRCKLCTPGTRTKLMCLFLEMYYTLTCVDIKFYIVLFASWMKIRYAKVHDTFSLILDVL